MLHCIYHMRDLRPQMLEKDRIWLPSPQKVIYTKTTNPTLMASWLVTRQDKTDGYFAYTFLFYYNTKGQENPKINER